MYRRAEYKLFDILSWLAAIFASLAITLCILFFLKHSVFYRNLALVFVAFSFFFQTQIFMYKLIVLEKRMLYLVGLSEQHFRIAKKKENLHLVLYFILFWTALMFLVFAFTPKP